MSVGLQITPIWSRVKTENFIGISMSQAATERLRWTTADLELFPEDDKRYQIIDGELFVSRAPHLPHQGVADAICT